MLRPVGEGHTPSCPPLPLSTRVMSPPFPHLTVMSQKSLPQILAQPGPGLGTSPSQGHPRRWGGQPSCAWHPAETDRIPELGAALKFILFNLPSWEPGQGAPSPGPRPPPFLHHHLYPFHPLQYIKSYFRCP